MSKHFSNNNSFHCNTNDNTNGYTATNNLSHGRGLSRNISEEDVLSLGSL